MVWGVRWFYVRRTTQFLLILLYYCYKLYNVILGFLWRHYQVATGLRTQGTLFMFVLCLLWSGARLSCWYYVMVLWISHFNFLFLTCDLIVFYTTCFTNLQVAMSSNSSKQQWLKVSLQDNNINKRNVWSSDF